MKFVRLNFVGNSGEWGYANILTRSEKTLRYGAEVIVGSSQGWTYDSRTPNSVSYIYYDVKNVGGSVASAQYPGILLRNTISGCKLFLGVNATNGYGINLSSSQVCQYENLAFPVGTSWLISMISGDSNEEFGNSFDDNFIPQSGTKIIASNLSTNTSYYAHYVRKNTSGTYYSFGFFIDPYWIGISGGCSTTVANPPLKLGILCGRIFGNLVHNEQLPQARYGCLKLTENTTSNDSEFSSYIKRNYNLNGSALNFFGTSTNIESEPSNQYNYGQLFSAAGSPIYGNSASSSNPKNSTMTVFVYACHQLANCYTTSSTTGLTRWCPYMVCIKSKDLNTYGVVPGDGVKGFLDTDVIRAAVNTYGQLYNNGEFIGLGDGILIRWNPENTDSL